MIVRRITEKLIQYNTSFTLCCSTTSIPRLEKWNVPKTATRTLSHSTHPPHICPYTIEVKEHNIINNTTFLIYYISLSVCKFRPIFIKGGINALIASDIAWSVIFSPYPLNTFLMIRFSSNTKKTGTAPPV